MKNSIPTLTLLFLSTILFSQREVIVTDMNGNGDAVIELNGGDASPPSYKEMILGFNQSNEGWLRMNTNHDLSFWTNNNKRMTVDKSGFIGIGTSAPTAALDVRGDVSVEGNLNQTGSGNTLIESTTGTITIKTAGATVTIDENGNINIDAAKNLAINAQGDISMSANTISMTAASNIDLIAGDNISQTANQNINQSSMNEHNITTSAYDLQSNTLSTSASLNASHIVTGIYSLNTSQYTLDVSGLVKLDGLQINLNSGTFGAARQFDPIQGAASSNGAVTGLINSASSSVLIGN